jgi:hypothetical protein
VLAACSKSSFASIFHTSSNLCYRLRSHTRQQQAGGIMPGVVGQQRRGRDGGDMW